jgi:Ca2+-binding EF-hand superfamily protein
MTPHAFATVIGLGFAAPIAVPAIEAAQAGQSQPRANIRMRFAEMDRDGDGAVTRTEWRGSDRSFRAHDWNGDGVLSGDEVRVGAAREGTEDDYDPARRPVFRNWTERGFTNLDRNGDGRISRAEWYYDREAFVRADRNRDNWLTKAEFLGHDVDDDREDRFEFLDANNNGRIERSEWHGSGDTFDWLDRNNDGSLSRAEATGGEFASKDLFAGLDENNDNRITPNEWQWSRQSFVRQDRNGDGALSRSELTNAQLKAQGAGDTGIAGRTIELDAARGWMNTGFDVRAGETITFEAKGTVQLSGNAADTAGPAGSGRRVRSAPLPNGNAGALIARIGESPAILVGSRETITASQSGRLYLSVNDDHLADNLGHFIVVIRRK